MKIIMQYCIWDELPIDLQDTIVHIYSKSYPDIDEIKDSFLSASSRYMAHCAKLKSKPVEVCSNDVALKTTKNDFDKSEKSNFVLTSDQSRYKRKLFYNLCGCNKHSNITCQKYPTVTEKEIELEN